MNSINRPMVNTVLHNACRIGDVDYLDFLLSKSEIKEIMHVKDKSGLAPLHIAIQQNNTAIMQILLNHGAYIELYNFENVTPLLYSIARIKLYGTKYLLSTKLLLDNNAKIIFNNPDILHNLLHVWEKSCELTSLLLLHMVKQNIDKLSDIHRIYGHKYNKTLESIKVMRNVYVKLGPDVKINYFEFMFVTVKDINVKYFNYKIDPNILEIDEYYVHLFDLKCKELEKHLDIINGNTI